MTEDSRRLLATYPVVSEIALRYNDTDRQGHLNNVAIAELYQEARIALRNQALGPLTPDVRIMVVEQTLRFYAEGDSWAPVSVASGVLRLGRTSYAFAHALFQSGQCIGSCDTIMVHTGPDGKPAPLPDQMRAALEGLGLGSAPSGGSGRP